MLLWWRAAFVVALVVAGSSKPSRTPATMHDLMFLTRDGCVNTPDLVNNVEDALTALGWPHDYQFINIGKLPQSDVRTGYPTPTVLWKSKDIFGMATPTPPYNQPT